ncbi:MAG: trypsin-like peptidase domain-containing protein, partial [Planctomycetota bacterium]
MIELIKATEPSVVAITHTPPAQANHSPLLFRQGDDGFFRDLRGIPGNARVETPAGAGVVIDASGLVLTQYLVVQPGQQHTIYTVDGDSYPAEIRAADPRSGLAVLDVSVERNDLAPLPIGKAENLQKGSGVVTIGNPNALLTDGQPTASYGTITNLARKADPQVNLNNAKDPLRTGYRTTLHHFGALIQTDARLGWNASGGAVVNLAGELVGITTTVSVIPGHEQSAGYAIPMNAAFRRIVDTLKEGKEVEYGLLGISFSVSARSKTTDGRYGIAVQQAYAGGPAGRAGLRSRDIIT